MAHWPTGRCALARQAESCSWWPLEGDLRPNSMQTTEPAISDGHATQPLRIVVADDSYLLREAVGQLLASEPGIEVVASCADGDELMAAVETYHPAVVVTDIRMPPSGDDEGIAIANRLRDTHPDIGVVVLSQYADPRYGLALLERGSDGRAYLLKERLRDREHLVAAMHAVANAGSVVDAKVVEALIAARIQAERSPLAELTQRELEILSHIAQGKSNQAIAETLFLTKRAVEKHINTIFMKLGLTRAEEVSRRVKAALIYLAEQPS
jgi:DNA-binding NarL/FixJ family response regulator